MNPVQIITFGRDASCSVVLSDPSVSRQHCQIVQFDNGTFSIVDLGSKNGTFVNGRRIYSETPLSWNDNVNMGNVAVPWRQYFNNRPGKPSGLSSRAVLGIVLGLVAVAGIVLLIMFFVNQDGGTSVQPQDTMPAVSHQIQTGNTEGGLNKTSDGLRSSDPNAGLEEQKNPAVHNDNTSTKSHAYVQGSVITVEGYVKMRIVDNSGECETIYIDKWPDVLPCENSQVQFVLESKGVLLRETESSKAWKCKSFVLLSIPETPAFASRYANRKVRVRGEWYTDPVTAEFIEVESISLL